jgi:hypothetical protein
MTLLWLVVSRESATEFAIDHKIYYLTHAPHEERRTQYLSSLEPRNDADHSTQPSLTADGKAVGR